MKKKIAYTLLVVLVIIVIGGFIGIRKFNNALFKEKPNYFRYTAESKPIHFKWASDSIGGYYEAQAAMTIPLKIKDLAHHFYMQFDTGAPYTLIYENDVKSLRTLGIDIQEVVKDEARYVERLDFILDDNHIKATMLKILPNYGNIFDNTDSIPNIKIGTIGSDFIADRITVIDFKKQQIEVFDVRPVWMNNSSGFQPFDFKARRIMLPVSVNNKNYEFLYDSGCSAFGLITTKNRFKKYIDKSTKAIAYGANSWGNSIPIHSQATDQQFNIANTDLSLKRVSHVDMYTWLQPLVTPFTRIGGWLGNQPFNESTLILDTKTEEFMVLTD